MAPIFHLTFLQGLTHFIHQILMESPETFVNKLREEYNIFL
jgi:hypothetical protein